MKEKKKKSLSIRSEFVQNVRGMSMRMIEAIYFIFFLPLSAINNSEVADLVVLTSYTSVFCLVNLLFFTFFYTLKSKAGRWKADIRFKGYWIEDAEKTSSE
jgi:hypothetical protein